MKSMTAARLLATAVDVTKNGSPGPEQTEMVARYLCELLGIPDDAAEVHDLLLEGDYDAVRRGQRLVKKVHGSDGFTSGVAAALCAEIDLPDDHAPAICRLLLALDALDESSDDDA